jgi:hypothetical protein
MLYDDAYIFLDGEGVNPQLYTFWMFLVVGCSHSR